VPRAVVVSSVLVVSQHATLPSACKPQLWLKASGDLVNVPTGGVDCLRGSRLPKHATLPFGLQTTTVIPTAETWGEASLRVASLRRTTL